MATSVLQELACQTIDKREPELYQISQDIWNNPELELEEQHAHDVLTSLLKKEGFDVEENFILPTGFRAVFGTDVGPNICVICEYDALPEIGHGSGRNLVTECTIASALGLKKVIRTSMAARKSVGKVTVLGCPASESGGAKVDMLTAGVFQNIDVVMKSQPQHHNIAKAVLLDMLQMKVTYSGKPTHASLPWEGRNALDAAVLCYNNIAALRQQTKTSMQIHGKSISLE
uniref:Peptidase M20 domain-containing protein 2-like n=1 Tax=Saccoglossus kowalevskii TaxID=10224 RepID=A0ABM0M3Q5_SACKO